MKKRLRKSQYNDYVAVDIINSDEKIVATPVYLQINKPSKLLWRNQESDNMIETEVVFDGEKLLCEDCDGFKWESPVQELLTETE